jgi:ribonuclease HI
VETEKRKVPLEVADLKALFEEGGEVLFRPAGVRAAQEGPPEKERDIEEEREKVERAKAKLMTIKTNKEYYAMLKEIEGTKRANTAREDELLAILARYEETEKRLAEFQAELDEVSGRFRERMVDVEAKMSSFDDDISALDSKKADVARRLEAGLARRFEMIFDRRDGHRDRPGEEAVVRGMPYEPLPPALQPAAAGRPDSHLSQLQPDPLLRGAGGGAFRRMKGKSLTLRTDGASRGNPGPAGVGAVIEIDGTGEQIELCAYIGEATNNVAEYRALLLALAEAEKMSPASLTVRSDSELLVRQLNGEYKVKSALLMPLFLEAVRRLRGFSSARILHVRREENAKADLLANRAIDAHFKNV